VVWAGGRVGFAASIWKGFNVDIQILGPGFAENSKGSNRLSGGGCARGGV